MTITDIKARITSIDWLRGLVMVLMLLDHSRDFIHAESLWHSPTDLSVIHSATFLTRWVTHLCAPVFVFLAGVSISLQMQRGKTPETTHHFLWTRGLWLIFCEFTILRFGETFQLGLHFLGMAQVIWVLGVSMIILAWLIRLPRGWVLGFGLLLVLGHNLLDVSAVAVRMTWIFQSSFSRNLWVILHQGGMIRWEGSSVLVLYPLIPWPGVMALGYGLGSIYSWETKRRVRALLWIGLACILAFILLRSVDLYGNPLSWRRQDTCFRTILSFLNTEKYPPSLLFLLMTLGPGVLLLAWREGKACGILGNILVTFGQVPMFFYLLQWPTANLIGILFHRLAGKPAIDLFGAPSSQSGFDLWVVYLAWALGLALLYPLCHWFAGVKRRRKDWWLSYL